MADTKVTNLTALSALANNDVLLSVDVSDTTQSASGTTKKVLVSSLSKRVYNINHYGGETSFVTGLQAAFNAAHAAGGGIVEVPAGTYAPTTQLTLTGNNVTIWFQGTLTDSGFTSEINGVLTFDLCNNIALIGANGLNYSSVTAAGSVARFGFLFTNCDGIYVSNIHATGGGHSQIYVQNSDNVTVENCLLEDGYYPFYYKANTADHTNVHIHGVACLNAKQGISVEGRGTPTHYRVKGVRVTNCYVTSAAPLANSHNIPITIDSCDNVVCAGNYVDANNNATMGYSVPDCDNFAFYGNTLKNLTKYPNGTLTYTGIGLEVVRTNHFRAWGNYFYNCITGYQVSALDFFSCDDIFEAGVGQATTAVQPAYVCIVGDCEQAKISGTVIDSPRPVYVGAAIVGRLLIENLRVVSSLTGGTDYALFHGSGFTINFLGINGLHIDIADSVPIFNIWPAAAGTCIGSNIFAKVTTPIVDDTYRFYRCEVATSRSIFYGPIVLDNLDFGFYRNATNLPFIYLHKVHFYNMDSTKLVSDTSTAASNFVAEDLYLDNVIQIFSQGSEAKMIADTGDPDAQNKDTRFVGQLYYDSTNKLMYVAVLEGGQTVGTHWKLMT